MLSAKFAAPHPALNTPFIPIDWNQFNSPVLMVAPPGNIWADDLPAMLATQHCSLLWLRTGREDKDPATLLLSLISMGRPVCSSLGETTLEQMRTTPGDLYGWQPLFGLLGQEFKADIPTSSAIVIEHADYIADHPLFSLLSSQLLSAIPDNIPKIILSHTELATTHLFEKFVFYDTQKLKIDSQRGEEIARSFLPAPKSDLLQKVIKLINGRAGIFRAILEAYSCLGPITADKIIHKAGNVKQLLAGIARAYFEVMSADEISALALTISLGYCCPDIIRALFGKEICPSGPWFQYLDNHWIRVRSEWRESLNSSLPIRVDTKIELAQKAASLLVQRGNLVSAAQLYLELKDYWHAGQTIAQLSEQLLDYGQWATLGRWFSQLPADIMHAFPLLIFVQGEIQAATGHLPEARQSFSISASRFSKQHDHAGVFKSLLAESTLAFWSNEIDHAKLATNNAASFEQTGQLGLIRGISNWQLGCISAYTGETDQALDYFNQAKNVIDEPELLKQNQKILELLQKQHEIQQQKEFYSQALSGTQQTEIEIADQIRKFVLSQPTNLLPLVNSLGWANTPLLLKLSQPDVQYKSTKGLKLYTFWRSVMNFYRADWRVKNNSVRTLAGNSLDPQNTGSLVVQTPPLNSSVFPTISNHQECNVNESILQSNVDQQNRLQMIVHMLGPFSVSIEDTTVKLPNSRGLSLLKYLLLHHKRDIPRDVLMETFWPDSEPDAARNNLNVALYTVRQTLHAVHDGPMIEFVNGLYHLDSRYQLWLDVDEFEHHQLMGQQSETGHDLQSAISEYEKATKLYQGDFLEDDLYEDWPISTRARLRIAHIDVLDHLARISYSQGNYTYSNTLCHLILESDNCREDTHCLLMRCYYNQGQQYLALRQYQICADALQSELGIEPDPLTKQLTERIRRRETIQ